MATDKESKRPNTFVTATDKESKRPNTFVTATDKESDAITRPPIPSNTTIMELKMYQYLAMETCMPSCHNVAYMALNLAAEVGELQGKLAKMIRRSKMTIDHNEAHYPPEVTNTEIGEARMELALEMGDVLWQLAGIAEVYNLSLDSVALLNLEKLKSRAQRGVIDGEGDHR